MQKVTSKDFKFVPSFYTQSEDDPIIVDSDPGPGDIDTIDPR